MPTLPNVKDDYASRHAAKDKQYTASYNDPETKEWIARMTPAEREQAEKLGLLKPMLSKNGSGAPGHDIAESKLAKIEATVPEIDFAPEPIPMPERSGAAGEEQSFELLRRLIPEALAQSNARLALECLVIVCGLGSLQGESMTSIAKRHGVTRAAVSRRCVDIAKTLNLNPSRAMRSTKARVTYREKRIQVITEQLNERTQHEHPGHP